MRQHQGNLDGRADWPARTASQATWQFSRPRGHEPRAGPNASARVVERRALDGDLLEKPADRLSRSARRDLRLAEMVAEDAGRPSKLGPQGCRLAKAAELARSQWRIEPWVLPEVAATAAHLRGVKGRRPPKGEKPATVDAVARGERADRDVTRHANQPGTANAWDRLPDRASRPRPGRTWPVGLVAWP